MKLIWKLNTLKNFGEIKIHEKYWTPADPLDCDTDI